MESSYYAVNYQQGKYCNGSGMTLDKPILDNTGNSIYVPLNRLKKILKSDKATLNLSLRTIDDL